MLPACKHVHRMPMLWVFERSIAGCSGVGRIAARHASLAMSPQHEQCASRCRQRPPFEARRQEQHAQLQHLIKRTTSRRVLKSLHAV